MKIEAIDLFCGIGGLTYGLQQAKIKVLAGLDNDKSCEYAYKENNKVEFICADVSNYSFENMKQMYSQDSIKILAGCAPCQTFSSQLPRFS
jgi:DNA (cytosine-5)-methyltransferase 1